MAKTNPTELFSDWSSVDNDYELVLATLADLFPGQEFVDLDAIEQRFVLAMALAKKQRAHLITFIGKA